MIRLSKSKKELINELKLLNQKYDVLKTSYDRNIEEYKDRDAELLKSEAKFRKAFITSPDAIVINRMSDGLIVLVNNGFTRMTGYTEEDTKGKTSVELNIWTDPSDREKIINAIGKDGGLKDFEGTFRRKDGSIRFGMMSASIIDLDGIPHNLNITRDITDRVNDAYALQESENRYRELFMNNPFPTYIFDSDTLEFIEVNDATLESYGYTREEFANMTLKDLRLPEDIPALVERVKKLGSLPFHSTDMHHRRKDGSIFPIENTSYALPEKKGRKTRLSMSLDITERIKAAEQMKIAREKAEASDKLKTSFLNNISHEVRTPLNGILGFAEIISQADLSEKERDEALSMVHESSNRLLETITNYMDISLLVSGEMTVTNKEFNPGNLLRKMFGKYKAICLSRRIELLLQIPADHERHLINSDIDLIGKILTQLIGNAIKFTEKGTIQIGYSKNNIEFEFFVNDTGIGITKGSEKTVFNYFEKDEQNVSKPSEGSGLGLSIAKGIIELLNGRIRMESELGKGTKFFFSIPFINIHASEPHYPENTIKEIRDRLKLILVAEDDSANFMYISALLRQNTTARIIHARNGKEAVEKFRENPGIEIVLMDMKMPEMNGFEATLGIKSINPEIPVIAITAYAMLGDEKRILDAGCDAYLSKPISKDKLIEKLTAFVRI